MLELVLFVMHGRNSYFMETKILIN